MSQRQARVLRLVVSRDLDQQLPKPIALKFERLSIDRADASAPPIALEATRLQTFRPDIAPLVRTIMRTFLSEVVPPDER